MPGPAEDEGLPIKMLNDRILVQLDDEDGERRSTGGILIPAIRAIYFVIILSLLYKKIF